MTPDEYREMFQRTYGYSADEGNSYLNCAVDPDEEGVSEYDRYYDFSGAIDYMDDDYFEEDPLSIDEQPERDGEVCVFPDTKTLDPMPLELSSEIFGVPFSQHDAEVAVQSLELGNVAELQFIGRASFAVEYDNLKSCPHMQLCLGLNPPPGSLKTHISNACPWCLNTPKLNPFKFFLMRGAFIPAFQPIRFKPDKYLETAVDFRGEGRLYHNHLFAHHTAARKLHGERPFINWNPYKVKFSNGIQLPHVEMHSYKDSAPVVIAFSSYVKKRTVRLPAQRSILAVAPNPDIPREDKPRNMPSRPRFHEPDKVSVRLKIGDDPVTISRISQDKS
jgi:hypothetical protein